MTDRKRRLIFHWTYDAWGGAQIYFLAIMKRARSEWDIIVILPRTSQPNILAFLDEIGVRYEFIDACAVADIPENRARIVCLSGERVAIFKYDGKVSAVSNVCQHQNGPLGEGKILDGCITCPWHGYQYVPETGASPPPFVEKVPTFNVRVKNGRVLVQPKPNPPGTRAEPALIETPSLVGADVRRLTSNSELDQSLLTSAPTTKL